MTTSTDERLKSKALLINNLVTAALNNPDNPDYVEGVIKNMRYVRIMAGDNLATYFTAEELQKVESIEKSGA